MPNSWAVGLYSYSKSHPEGDGFSRFYESILTTFQVVGIAPTYFAAEGADYSGDLTKFGGAAHTRALKSGFTDICVMSLVANPEGSTRPGYDSFASASLSYVEGVGETMLCLALEERFMAFGGDTFERLLRSLSGLLRWDFGYALLQPVEKKPEFHILGLDSGALDQEEIRKLNRWYASLPEDRLHKLRDIYPYMLINDKQLAERVSRTQTLRDIARSDERFELTRIDESSLWLWKVPQEEVGNLRGQLASCEVLIS